MSLFDKLQPIAEGRKTLQAIGIDPFNLVLEEIISANEARINGKKTILAGTNNYLGLTFNEECIEASCKAARAQGTGTTGSRMANGTFDDHVALEQDLARFYDSRSAIVFSTGYLANLGILTALAGPGDVIVLDGDSHASLYDGCRMTGAEIIRFRHNDAADLEKRLRRLGDKISNTLILTEGIYSMLGDRAPLQDIVEVKREYGGLLLVDEAHSLGVLGEHGRGLTEEVGVEADVDFIVGTFSKSLGATGGFCVSQREELDLIRYASRPYIFTASPSPSVIASTRKALEILGSRPELRARLWDNANRLYSGLQSMGFTLGPQPSPVVAVMLESREHAAQLWRGLLDNGVYVNLIFPPAAPNGTSLVRCSVSAGHSTEQIQYILGVFAEMCENKPARGVG